MRDAPANNYIRVCKDISFITHVSAFHHFHPVSLSDPIFSSLVATVLVSVEDPI